MPKQLSRRSLAKSTAWTIPAVAVASAAPAVAASCTPSSVSRSSAVTWTSSQTNFSSPDGDPEFHTVEYVFTNTGPDPVGTEIPFQVQVVITTLDGEEATLAVQSASNATATVTNDDVENGDGTYTDTATVTAHSTSSIPVNGTFAVTVLATYGYLPSGDVTETVTVQSPIVSTNTENCVTTTSATTITGQSNGTSYTTP